MNPFRHLLLSLFSAIILVFYLTVPLQAEHSFSREYRLKVGLIFNLAQFVVFPEPCGPRAPGRFTVGILGADPFGEEIDILTGKCIQDKPIQIKRYHTIDDVQDCHMLFIGASEKTGIKWIIDRLKAKSILTISDMEGFAEYGGMINMVTVNNRIRFKVNLSRVKTAGLKISAHFLKLATIIDQQQPQGDTGTIYENIAP